MKWHWNVPISVPQFEKLKEGLLSYFNLNLRLPIETITFNPHTNELSIAVGYSSPSELRESLSAYISGYFQAIKL